MTTAASAVPGQHPIRVALRLVPRVFFALALMVLLLAVLSPRSVEPSNLLSLIRQGATIGLVAIGQTIVLMSGGLDLSVGSVVILADVMSAQLINGRDEAVLPVVAFVLAMGLGIGLINGLLVTRFRVTPFIATLGMNFVVFGAALILSGGAPRGAVPDSLRFWGNGFALGVIPTAAIVWITITIIAAALLARTVYGRRLTAVGSNRRFAFFSGVNDSRVILTAYMVSGFMAAAGGVLLVAFIGVGTLEVGTDFLLGSIAAAVIGGTSFDGGRGTIWGTFGGVLFLMVLYSILTVLALPTSGRRIAEGIIILAALALYSRQRD